MGKSSANGASNSGGLSLDGGLSFICFMGKSSNNSWGVFQQTMFYDQGVIYCKICKSPAQSVTYAAKFPNLGKKRDDKLSFASGKPS